MTRLNTLALWFAALLIVLLGLSVGCSGSTSPAAKPAEPTVKVEVDTVIIDLRIWQDIAEPQSLKVSARVALDPESDMRPTGIRHSGSTRGSLEQGRYKYRQIKVADVGLRIWQQASDPERIYVSACAEPCLTARSDYRAHRVGDVWYSAFEAETEWFRPLGKVRVLLDDGEDATTGRRYGDLRIAVPRANPGLQSDRMHLLALRDVFDADPPLDWSVATPTADWEGVTVSGSPARVTGLDLSNRNLRGEVWGYLGDLVELRTLRLDGNQLTGILPTKLQFLKQLEVLRLAGNELSGCTAPQLWSAEQHDLADTGLERCPVLILEKRSDLPYHVSLLGGDRRSEHLHLIIDVPYQRVTTVRGSPHDEPETGEHGHELPPAIRTLGCRDPGYAIQYRGAHVCWDWDTGFDRERSHSSGCIYDCGGEFSPASWVEKMAASHWVVIARWDSQAKQWSSEWP